MHLPKINISKKEKNTSLDFPTSCTWERVKWYVHLRSWLVLQHHRPQASLVGSTLGKTYEDCWDFYEVSRNIASRMLLQLQQRSDAFCLPLLHTIKEKRFENRFLMIDSFNITEGTNRVHTGVLSEWITKEERGYVHKIRWRVEHINTQTRKTQVSRIMYTKTKSNSMELIANGQEILKEKAPKFLEFEAKYG